MNFFNFYEKTRWLNMLILCCLIFGFFTCSYLIFAFKYREKPAIMKYNKNIVEKYALISQRKLFTEKKINE